MGPHLGPTPTKVSCAAVSSLHGLLEPVGAMFRDPGISSLCGMSGERKRVAALGKIDSEKYRSPEQSSDEVEGLARLGFTRQP